jgi:hypothetical protein
MSDAIADALNRLSTLKAQGETLADEHEAARRRLIPSDILAQLDALDHEFTETEKDLTEQVALEETKIKQLVLTRGTSAAGSHLQAVLTAGRVTWDSKGLSAYATQHPEIQAYRKVGEPYVVIRGRGVRSASH